MVGIHNDSVSVPLVWLVLAVTHQRLGQPEEAQQWLDKALRWRDAIVRRGDKAASAPPPGLLLSNWLECHVLLREAKTLLKSEVEQE